MTISRKREPKIVAMHKRLCIFVAEDPEDRLWIHITRRLEDSLKHGLNGGLRVNPLLLILGFVALVVVGIFVFFSYGLP
jgi:hypothetical protein